MAKTSGLRDTLLERSIGRSPTWGESPFQGLGETSGTFPKAPDYPQLLGPKAPTGLPAPAPNAPSRVPPAWDRYVTGLNMQKAYANNWNPNPMLVRLMGER